MAKKVNKKIVFAVMGAIAAALAVYGFAVDGNALAEFVCNVGVLECVE